MPATALPAAPMSPWLAYGLPVLFGWIVLRRVRRNFGRQPWRPVRTWLRVVILALVAALLAFSAMFVPSMRLPLAIGGLCGVGIGLLALRHTHVGWSNGERGYTPNPWIGGALSLLLVGRLLWRWTQGGLLQQPQGSTGFTTGLAATLIVYSLVHAIGLIRQILALPPQAPAVDAPGVDAPPGRSTDVARAQDVSDR